MTMITPSYLGETIEYSSLHACRSTLEDPTVTVATQPADSGFWMVKEYGNLTTSDVMLRINACRFLMALCGLGILLVAEMILK